MKFITTATAFLLSVAAPCLCAQDSAAEARRQAVRDYQTKAVRLYPELGKSGSPIHQSFLKAYDEALKADDPIVRQSDWPMVLARYASESIDPVTGSTNAVYDAGVLAWLRKTREEKAERVKAAQTAQADELQRRQVQAELERNSVVVHGRVYQVADDGLIIEAKFLDGYESGTGPNAPMIVRDLDGSINPQKSGFAPRYRTERIFLSGHPEKDSLVDGSEIAAVAAPVGTYRYTSASGAVRTIHSWKVLKALNVGR